MRDARRFALHTLAAGSLLGAVVASSPAASAQDKTAEAQARFKEGVKAYERGDYERARLLFLQSEALVARGSVLRNLGLAELELGRPVEALRHLRAALAMPDLDPRRRSVAEHDLRDAYAASAHIQLETETGASVQIDGEALDGKAPFAEPVDLMPGRHAIVAVLGDRSARTELDLQPGGLVTVSLALDPVIPAAPTTGVAPGPATLHSAAPESAPSPATPRPAAATAPLAGATRPDAASAPLAGATGAGAGSADATALRPTFWTSRREIGLAAFVAGAASTVAGVYFYAQSNDARDRAERARAGLPGSTCSGATQPAACADVSGARDAQRTDAILNYVFLGVGAAGLVAGATMLLWPSSSPAAVGFEPAITTRGGGLRVRGAF